MKKRLQVCAHLEGAGHREVEATVARLERHCVWDDMADDVRNVIRISMYCTNTTEGPLVPHMPEATPHRRERNTVVHFDFFYVGEGAVDSVIDTAGVFQYVLVIVEHVSGYTWLRPSRACTRAAPLKMLCSGVPRLGRKPRR